MEGALRERAAKSLPQVVALEVALAQVEDEEADAGATRDTIKVEILRRMTTKKKMRMAVSSC